MVRSASPGVYIAGHLLVMDIRLKVHAMITCTILFRITQLEISRINFTIIIAILDSGGVDTTYILWY
jgi:competence protein ComGF